MKLTVSTRPLEDNEAIHIYGNDNDGWAVCLTRTTMSGAHQIWPNIFSQTPRTLEECEAFIRERPSFRSTIGHRCSCCHTMEDGELA